MDPPPIAPTSSLDQMDEPPSVEAMASLSSIGSLYDEPGALSPGRGGDDAEPAWLQNAVASAAQEPASPALRGSMASSDTEEPAWLALAAASVDLEGGGNLDTSVQVDADQPAVAAFSRALVCMPAQSTGDSPVPKHPTEPSVYFAVSRYNVHRTPLVQPTMKSGLAAGSPTRRRLRGKPSRSSRLANSAQVSSAR